MAHNVKGNGAEERDETAIKESHDSDDDKEGCHVVGGREEHGEGANAEEGDLGKAWSGCEVRCERDEGGKV